VRSSDPALRRAACDISDFYVDVSYQGETVRARVGDGFLKLMRAETISSRCRPVILQRADESIARFRLRWMQSYCTARTTWPARASRIT